MMQLDFLLTLSSDESFIAGCFKDEITAKDERISKKNNYFVVNFYLARNIYKSSPSKIIPICLFEKSMELH